MLSLSHTLLIFVSIHDLSGEMTCIRGLSNYINVSASDKQIVPIQSILGNIQAIFPSTTFTCNGIINQITGWYQVHVMDDLNNSMIVPATINLQIWHPISDSHYELVSNTSFPSALDDEPRTVHNLTMQFYNGSVLGIYIHTSRSSYGPGTMTVLKNGDVPQSLLHITDDEPCTFDATTAGVLSITPTDAEIVLDYVVSNEDMDQTFYCEQDDHTAQDNQIADSKNMLLIVIIPSAVGALIIIIIIVILMLIYCRRRRRRSRIRIPSHYTYSRVGSEVDAKAILTSFEASVPHNCSEIREELSEAEINPDEIEHQDKIGSGNFGVVHHGIWNHGGKKEEVAIKTAHKEASEEEKIKLQREAATVKQLLHNNIIKFCGVITSRDKVMVVLEYLPNGNLLDFLRSARPKEGEVVCQQLPQVLIRFAHEIGCGMNYLSNKNYIHRDLAARNILLSEENVCKIADFGLSRGLDYDGYYKTKGQGIPVKWTAPEALLYRTYTTASDVWSYGVVLYEIWSLGQKPFGDKDSREVLKLLENGYRLPPPPGCSRHVYNVMIQCWNPTSELRPNFATLLEEFSKSQPLHVLFNWIEKDKQEGGPQCDILGAPLEAGHDLYPDLQNKYTINNND